MRSLCSAARRRAESPHHGTEVDRASVMIYVTVCNFRAVNRCRNITRPDYSRSQKKLERLASEAGDRARAGTPAEADADAVLLALHWSRLESSSFHPCVDDLPFIVITVRLHGSL